MKGIISALAILIFYGQAFALTIATGSPDGTYYKVAQDIKEIADKEGLRVDIIQTNGSFDNINLLGEGKVDLAILQLDVLKFVAEVMQAEGRINVFEEARVVLNLYPEEIHIITRDENIRSLYQLEGKKVAVGPEKSGSALTAEVLLAVHDLRVDKSFASPSEALAKLRTGELEALIFVGGAPVPAFENLDKSYRFVRVPRNSVLEQIYQKKTIEPTVYPWAGEVNTFAVPSVIMTRDRRDPEYVEAIQKLVLAILSNKDKLDAGGHPKWKSSAVRYTAGNIGYAPSNDIIQVLNVLDRLGYRVSKK